MVDTFYKKVLSDVTKMKTLISFTTQLYQLCQYGNQTSKHHMVNMENLKIILCTLIPKPVRSLHLQDTDSHLGAHYLERKEKEHVLYKSLLSRQQSTFSIESCLTSKWKERELHICGLTRRWHITKLRQMECSMQGYHEYFLSLSTVQFQRCNILANYQNTSHRNNRSWHHWIFMSSFH